MQKVARNSWVFLLKKYCCPEATAHSHSADTKLPDLMPAPTISIPLNVCVLNSQVWSTEFVTTHATKSVITPKVSAENNLKRGSLTKGNI
jgi:hypothetical protein